MKNVASTPYSPGDIAHDHAGRTGLSRARRCQINGERVRPEARDIYELAYLKHRTGASDVEIWRAIDRVGNDRAKIERALSTYPVFFCCQV